VFQRLLGVLLRISRRYEWRYSGLAAIPERDHRKPRKRA